jgi:hypothetical protein
VRALIRAAMAAPMVRVGTELLIRRSFSSR